MPSPSTTEPQTLAAIDEEIAILETRLLGLKSRRNSLVPILRLPVEVIGRIIRQTQLLKFRQPDTDAGFLEFRLSRHWRNLMVACRALRVVALAVPELWMFIDTGCPNVDYPAMCTARAKDAPFVLSYNSHRDRDGPTQTQKHDLVVNFSRAYAVCLTLEENDLVQTLLQIPAPRLNTLQIETHVMHKIPPALSALSHQLVELTFWDVDLRGCPSYAWPVMRRLRLQHTILTPDSLCSMVFQMPLLEHLVIRSIEGLDDEHVSNKLDTSPRNQHALHNLHTIFFQIRPAACVSLLKVLHSSVHSCQKLDVDFLNAYEGDGTFVSGDNG
jgi:hypothetical protein